MGYGKSGVRRMGEMGAVGEKTNTLSIRQHGDGNALVESALDEVLGRLPKELVELHTALFRILLVYHDELHVDN